MRKHLLLVIFVIWSIAGFSQNFSNGRKSNENLHKIIDRYIKSFPEYEKFNGVILIGEGDSILFFKGYGKANLEFKIPNGTETRFQIGSITKAFTAVLTLKLVEEGYIDLNKSISDYLSFYPNEFGKQITIYNLLTNTSGIPHHYQVVPDYFTKEDHYFHTPKELISLFWNVPLKHMPGEEFTYSSPGYYILGFILQQVTKRSYSELLKEYIFDPLEMKDTYVENNRTTDINLATGYQRGLEGLVKAYAEDKSTALAAGDILSTAYDLYLFQRILNPNNDKILSIKSKQILFEPIFENNPITMIGPHHEIPYDNGTKKMAVSLMNGSSSGYVSYLGRQTKKDRCVIVLSNINGDDVVRIADDIGDIYNREFLGISIGERAPLTKALPKSKDILESELDKVTGFYKNNQRQGSYTGIVKANKNLFYLNFNKTYGIQTCMQLTPIECDSFYLSHNTDFSCSFQRDDKGNIQEFKAYRKGRNFNTSEIVEHEGKDNSIYEGYFTSLELQKTFCISSKDSQLIFDSFLGEKNVELVFLEKDLFGFNKGFIRFFRGMDEEIAGFEVFTKDTDKTFGSKFIKIVYS